jgi:hypothetical protein
MCKQWLEERRAFEKLLVQRILDFKSGENYYVWCCFN